MTVRIVHKNSSTPGKNPTAAQLSNGELSINYHSDGPFLSVKDTDGNIIRVGGVWISNNSPPDPAKGALWVHPDNNILYVRNDNDWIAIAGGGGGNGGSGDVTAVTEGPGIDVQNSAGPIPQVSIDLHARSGLETTPAGDGGQLRVNAGTGLRINAGTGALEATAGGLTYIGTVDLTDNDAADIPALGVDDAGNLYANTGTGNAGANWSIGNIRVTPGDLVAWTGTAWTYIPTGTPGSLLTVNGNAGITATTVGSTTDIAVDLHTSANGNDSGLETDPAGGDGELRVQAGAGLSIVDDGGANQGDLVVDAANISLPNGGDGTGNFGYWNRDEPAGGDVLSPRTAGDDVFTSGDLRIGNTAAAPRALISGATGEIRSGTLENGDEVTTGTGLVMADNTGDLVRSAPGDGLEINSGRLRADLLANGGLRLTATDGSGELAVDAANMPAPGNDQSFGYWTRDNGDSTLTPRTTTDIVMVAGGTAAAPTLAHAGDLTTGIAFPANTEIELATNGVDRVRITDGSTVVNEDGNDHDFRVEGDADEDLLLVDAGTDVVGISETAANIATAHTANGDLKLLVAGDAQVTGDIQYTSQNGAHLAGFRNMLINGDFRVFQRGFTGSTTSQVTYVTADMWRIGNNGATVNVGRVDGPNEFANGVSVDGAAQFQNRIELPAAGQRGLFQNNSVWTLSFWSTETTLGNVSATVFFGQTNITFGAGWTQQAALAQVGSSGAWRRYAMRVICDQAPAAADLWASVTINFTGAAALAGVQFEPGPVVTPFEYRPFEMEINMCQRYFFRAPTSYIVWSGACTLSAGYNVSAPLPVTQRVSPPHTINNITTLGNNNFTGGVFPSTLPGSNTNQSITIASVATGNGQGYFFAGFDASSEL